MGHIHRELTKYFHEGARRYHFRNCNENFFDTAIGRRKLFTYDIEYACKYCFGFKEASA